MLPVGGDGSPERGVGGHLAVHRGEGGGEGEGGGRPGQRRYSRASYDGLRRYDNHREGRFKTLCLLSRLSLMIFAFQVYLLLLMLV